MVGLRIGLGLGFRVRVRRPDSSGNLLLRRKLHLARVRDGLITEFTSVWDGLIIGPTRRL